MGWSVAELRMSRRDKSKIVAGTAAEPLKRIEMLPILTKRQTQILAVP